MDFQEAIAFENIPHPASSRKISIDNRVLGLLLNVTSLLFPVYAYRLIYRLFLTPKRSKETKAERLLLQEGKKYLLHFEQGLYVLHSEGQGKLVLLVHGLDGRGIDLNSLVEPLVQSGFRVVFFDMPAHGLSPQSQTDIFQCARFIRTVDDYFGNNTQAIISLSLGASWVFNAISQGLAIKQHICLSPIASCANLLIKFQRRLGLFDKTINALSGHIASDYGHTFWQDCAPLHLVRKVEKLPQGLVVHDHNNKEVPFNEGKMLAENWQNAALFEVQNLKQKRLLDDQQVIEAILAFLNKTSV